MILALPGLSDYRNELIRGEGCWFFTLAAFRLATQAGAAEVFAVSGGIALAALFFRPAAVRPGWQHFQASPASRLRPVGPYSRQSTGPGPGRAPDCPFFRCLAGGIPVSPAKSLFRFFSFDTAKAMGQAFNSYARIRPDGPRHPLFGSLASFPRNSMEIRSPFLLPLLFFAAARPGQWPRPLQPARRRLRHRHTLVLAVSSSECSLFPGRYHLGPLLPFSPRPSSPWAS